MDKTEIIILIVIYVVVGIVCSVVSYNLAVSHGQNYNKAGVLGFFFGFWGVFVTIKDCLESVAYRLNKLENEHTVEEKITTEQNVSENK